MYEFWYDYINLKMEKKNDYDTWTQIDSQFA